MLLAWFEILVELLKLILKWLQEAGPRVVNYFRLARRAGNECGQLTLAAALAGLALLWGFDTLRTPIAAARPTKELKELLRRPHWIAYDPRDWNPTPTDYPAFRPLLTELSIAADLDALRQAGFTGVVLFSCNGPLAWVPEMAKQRGMAVIVGVWNPLDAHEIGVAIRLKPFADAYSIGHGGLARGDYMAAELRQAMARVRRRTGRPVSTCEPYDTMFHHLGDPETASERTEAVVLGDWLFPDLGRTWAQPESDAADADRFTLSVSGAITRLRRAIGRLRRIALNQGNGKPLLLHMLCYPAGGFPAGSEANQQAFFQQLLASPEMSLGEDSPPFVVTGAFPARWKAPRQFAPWDAENSLFRDDRQPRPAVRVLPVLPLPPLVPTPGGTP